MIREVLSGGEGEDEEGMMRAGALVEKFGEGVRKLDSCLDILIDYYHSIPKEERSHILRECFFMSLDNQVGDLLNKVIKKADDSEIVCYDSERVEEKYAAFMDEVDRDRSDVIKRRSRLKRSKEKRKKLREITRVYQGDGFGRAYLNQIVGLGDVCDLLGG